MSSSSQEDLVECPICFNKISQASIENHVNKCLFLTESTSKRQQTPTPKRSLALRGDDYTNSPSPKRSKNSSPISNEITKKFRSNYDSSGSSNSSKVQWQESQDDNSNKTKKNEPKRIEESQPLAEKMRPTNIIKYVGQTHAIGQSSTLYQLLTKTEIPNVILWGPPGCGKTSLAHIIESMCKHSPDAKYRFVKLSAATSGVNDVKDLATTACNDLKFKRRTVVFLDEIHRFNKAQQDIFLPHIESGTVTLIGATTENPSYSLNSALLSRCRVIVLEKLTVDDLKVILERAVNTLEGSIIDKSKNTNLNLSKDNKKFFLDKAAIEFLAETSDGDARIALGGLELAIQYKTRGESAEDNSTNFVSLDDIKDSLKKSHMLYDRKGDQHYDMISALHKSVRASDENASIYWLTRMIKGGEDPVYIGRRLVRAAAEDIGLEDPKALVLAINTMQACKMLGSPECDVLLAQLATYLARAPKSRLMEDSLRAAQRFVSTYKDAQPAVPLHLRKKPGLSNDNGNGNQVSYFPPEIQDVNFF